MAFNISIRLREDEEMVMQRWVRRGASLAGVLVATGLGLGGLLKWSPAIAQGTAPAIAVSSSLPKATELPIPSRQAVTELPLPDKFPRPATRIASDRSAKIYLVNYTNAKIDYAVLGLTGESLLSGLLEAPEQSVAQLPDLPFPLNLSLRRQDNGFIAVRPLVQGGDLYLIMDFAPSFELDTNYININEGGEVYLY